MLTESLQHVFVLPRENRRSGASDETACPDGVVKKEVNSEVSGGKCCSSVEHFFRIPQVNHPTRPKGWRN